MLDRIQIPPPYQVIKYRLTSPLRVSLSRKGICYSLNKQKPDSAKKTRFDNLINFVINFCDFSIRRKTEL